MICQRGAVSDERLRVDSSRMVVVGNATMLDPATRLAVDQDFIAASLNWMLRFMTVPNARMPRCPSTWRNESPMAREALACCTIIATAPAICSRVLSGDSAALSRVVSARLRGMRGNRRAVFGTLPRA